MTEQYIFYKIQNKYASQIEWVKRSIENPNNFINYKGWLYCSSDVSQILSETHSSDFESLDWSGTWMDKTNVPEWCIGWLDSKGNLYGCEMYQHQYIAMYFLKKNREDLINENWIRVLTNSMFECCSEIISREQRDWLRKNGYIIPRRVQPFKIYQS